MTLSLSARKVVKRYGGVVALSDANLDIRSGEVLALIGANGSGKSTLSKIINGVVVLDGGQLLLDGKSIKFASPHAAKNLGISTVFQELSLVPQMTVAENIWLTHEPLKGGRVDRAEINRRTSELLSLFSGMFKSTLTPDMPIGPLPPDEKQIIEILKAVSFNPRLLILDEATASLDSRQVQRLFELVTRWKADGKAIVFVSHRMEEIFQIADRYSVLRNGKTVGEGAMKDVTTKDLVDLMVEEARVENVVKRVRPTAADLAARPVQLEVKNLRTAGVSGVSVQLHEGELLGIGGLKGQGQRELLLALFGDLPYLGSVTLNGVEAHFNHPRQAMQQGIALVPGERAKEGLLFIRSILENFLVPSWRNYGFPLRMGRARQDTTEMASRLSLKMAGLDEPVSGLSGGNAQKVVIGKWLLRNPRVLLLDDPTKGVDVGTKAELYKLLAQLCSAGKSVLFYSSDDEELIGLCDRVLVMHDGTIGSELAGESLTKANLIAASLGAAHLDAAQETCAMMRSRWQNITYRNPYLFALLLFVIAVAANFILQPNLFDRESLNNNMRVFLPLILVSVGQAFVILGGGIDISVGAIVSVVNALLATQIGLKGDPNTAIVWMIVALFVGMIAGAINGFFVAYLRLQPIITTYATSFLFAGVALFILPNPGGGVPSTFTQFYRDTTPIGLPLAFYIIFLVLIGWYALRQTRFGRYLFAVGGKADAAYETGVPVSGVQFSTYVLSGFMSALGGIAITLLTASGNAQVGDALTLSSITAVVIGGTALSGGVGGVAGAIIGAIILGLIRNIISFANVETWWQTFVNAAIIVIALAMPGILNLFRRKRA